MLGNPTLFVENNLFLLKEIDHNLFEIKDTDALFDVLIQKKEDIFEAHLGSSINVDVETPRETNGGELAIIVPFFNAGCPPEMKDNFEKFLDNINHPNVFVIEVAFGDRPFLISESAKFIRIRAGEECFMWQKERMLNLALKRLPERFRNVAWVDGDIIFQNENWINETIEKLDKYCFLQLFSTADWLGADGSIKYYFHSIIKKKSDALKGLQEGHPKGFHPGFAWAARREVLEKVGFFDRHIAGNGDSFIFYAIVGTLNSWNFQMLKKLLGFNYVFLKYRKQMREIADGSASYVNGNIQHLYHGEYEKRNYNGRQDILIRNDFDPLEDIKLAKNGLYEWNLDSPRAQKIFSEIKEYLNSR